MTGIGNYANARTGMPCTLWTSAAFFKSELYVCLGTLLPSIDCLIMKICNFWAALSQGPWPIYRRKKLHCFEHVIFSYHHQVNTRYNIVYYNIVHTHKQRVQKNHRRNNRRDGVAMARKEIGAHLDSVFFSRFLLKCRFCFSFFHISFSKGRKEKKG